MSETRHKDKIIKLLEEKDRSLSELRKCTTRQAIQYHIPILCKKGDIKPYIIGSGLKDNEIFYTIKNNYENPQDIIKLIDKMCDKDSTISEQSRDEFIDLYMKKSEKKITDDTNSHVNYWKNERSNLIQKGIRIYDDENFSDKMLEYGSDIWLRIRKDGITRDEYIKLIKEQVERHIQYSTRLFGDKTVCFKEFNLIDSDECDRLLEERKRKENTMIAKKAAFRIAYDLMCNTTPDLKGLVAFSLTHKDENGNYDLVGIDDMDGKLRPYSGFLRFHPRYEK